MLKRLLVGLILGVVIGGATAAVLVQGLGWSAGFPNAVFAYVAAAVTGVLTGLIAGKPIWSSDGRIEAGLKAFFGALLAIGGMFALRQWAKVDVDLSAFKAGHAVIGSLPAASLPIIAMVLAGFYEVDNSPSDAAEPAGSKTTARGAPPGPKGAGRARVAEASALEEDDEEVAASGAKNKKSR